MLSEKRDKLFAEIDERYRNRRLWIRIRISWVAIALAFIASGLALLFPEWDHWPTDASLLFILIAVLVSPTKEIIARTPLRESAGFPRDQAHPQTD